MGKHFVIRQMPPKLASDKEPWKNSVPIAFSFCAYFLQQIPLDGFHFTSVMHSDQPYLSDTEYFEVVFIRTVEIAVPVPQAPTVIRHLGNNISAGQQAVIRKIDYTLTINATPLLPLADDLEPMFWFLEEVTKAEFENGIFLMKLPELTSRLDAEGLKS